MKEYIIKVDVDKKGIMGGVPLVEKAEELVRCKDCKMGKPLTLPDGTNVIECRGYLCHAPDWYCADNKRKKGRRSGNETISR